MTHVKNHPINNAKSGGRYAERLSVGLLLLLSVIVLLQFITRYLLNDSLAWTEEAARYLLVALVFSGSLYLVHRGEHILLELVYRFTSRINVKPLMISAQLVSAFYYLVLSVFGLILTLSTEQSMISVPMPKWIFYGFISVMLALSCLVSVKRLIRSAGMSGAELIDDLDLRNVTSE